MPELELSSGRAKKLFKSLKRRTDKYDRLYWEKGQKVHGIRLEHDVICRKSKKSGDVRYEFVDTSKPVSNRSKNRVYRVQATLRKDGIKLRGYIGKKGTPKQRLAKYSLHDADSPVSDIYTEYNGANIAGLLHVKLPVIENNQRSFLIMREVPGASLADIIDADLTHQEPMTLHQRLELSIALMEALYTQVSQYEHRHRDIKPDNIIVDRDNEGRIKQVYILDYGFVVLAKQLDRRSAGTPGYAAPEVWRGQTWKQSTKTDVYSMGCIIALIWGINYSMLALSDNYIKAIDTLFGNIANLDKLNQSIIRDSLARMFADRPEHRPDIREIISIFKTIDLDRKASITETATPTTKPPLPIKLFNFFPEVSSEKPSTAPEPVQQYERLV